MHCELLLKPTECPLPCDVTVDASAGVTLLPADRITTSSTAVTSLVGGVTSLGGSARKRTASLRERRRGGDVIIGPPTQNEFSVTLYFKVAELKTDIIC